MNKKCRYCFAILFHICLFSFSQSTEPKGRTLLGSFVFEGVVYNYSYILTPNGTSSLSIEPAEKKQSDRVAVQVEQLPDIQKKLIDINPPLKTTDLRKVAAIEQILSSNDSTLLPTAISNIDSLSHLLDSLKGLAAPSDTALIAESMQYFLDLKTKLSASGVLSAGQKAEFKLNDFTPEVAKAHIKQSLLNNLDPSERVKPSVGKSAEEQSAAIFYQITARLNFEDDEPVTAYLRLLHETIDGYIKNVPVQVEITDVEFDKIKKDGLSKKERKNYDSVVVNDKTVWRRTFDIDLPIQLRVKTASFEFEEGTVKNIVAEFSCDQAGVDETIIFRNNKPISISGKFDPGNLGVHQIFAYETADHFKFKKTEIYRPDRKLVLELNPNLKEFLDKYDSDIILDVEDWDGERLLYFWLNELVRYEIILENYKEDYSPADRKYNLSPAQPIVEVRKQLRSRILSVRAYSDFIGVDSDQPNGLIQFEASVYANFITERFQGFIGWFNNFNYTGYFTNVQLNGTLSKIEDNNKYLILTETNADREQQANGNKRLLVRPIDFYRYKNNGINISTTLLKQNFASAKSNFQLNGSYGFIRSGISDSLRLVGGTFEKTAVGNERLVAAFESHLNILYQFSPDSRYGFYAGVGRSWLKIRNNEVQKTKEHKSQVNVIFFEGFLSTNNSNSSRLFLRSRIYLQKGDPDRNFSQVQLGYLVDVFKAKSSNP